MLKVLRPYERGKIYTLGKFSRECGPGLQFFWPFVQQIEVIDTRSAEERAAAPPPAGLTPEQLRENRIAVWGILGTWSWGVVCIYAFSRGGPLARVCLFISGVLIAWLAVVSIREGKVYARHVVMRRDRDRGSFWSFIVAYFVAAAAAMLSAIFWP